MARTAEESRLVENYRRSCGYVEPPRDLWPAKHPDLDGPAWDRLHDWFDENTDDARDAVLVFICARSNCSIGWAYQTTDGWAKKRSPMYDPNGHN